jgi:hypothetical protein
MENRLHTEKCIPGHIGSVVSRELDAKNVADIHKNGVVWKNSMGLLQEGMRPDHR